MISIRRPGPPDFDIFDEMEKDTKIDKSALDDEIIKIPYVQGKWMKVFFYLQDQLRQETTAYERIKHDTTQYFLGHASDDEYRRRPLNRKLLKSEVDSFVDVDGDVVEAAERVAIIASTMGVVEKFISELNWRGSNLGKTIDFLRWKNGG